MRKNLVTELRLHQKLDSYSLSCLIRAVEPLHLRFFGGERIHYRGPSRIDSFEG